MIQSRWQNYRCQQQPPGQLQELSKYKTASPPNFPVQRKLGDAEIAAIGRSTSEGKIVISDTPRSGISSVSTSEGLLREELITAATVNSQKQREIDSLRAELGQAYLKTERAKKTDMLHLLQSQKRDDLASLVSSKSNPSLAAKLEDLKHNYDAQNWILRDELTKALDDRNILEQRVHALEGLTRALESQNGLLATRLRLATTCSSTRPVTPGTKFFYPKEGEKGTTEIEVPGIEKYNASTGGNILLSELQRRPNTRSLDPSSADGKLESVVDELINRVENMKQSPPITSAALEKLHVAASRVESAGDSIEALAKKVSNLEEKLAGSDVLQSVTRNADRQSTKIFEISDALQNMEGKFDLLVKNVVHKIDEVRQLYHAQRKRDTSLGNGAKSPGSQRLDMLTRELGEILAYIKNSKVEVGRLSKDLSKLDRKVDSIACRRSADSGSRLDGTGQVIVSFLASDIEMLKNEIYSLREHINRTTVHPLRVEVDRFLDRIAHTSTYLTDLKRKAFDVNRMTSDECTKRV